MEDLVQDAVVEVLTHTPEQDLERMGSRELTSWLVRAVRCKASAGWRRPALDTSALTDELESTVPDALAVVISKEQTQAIADATAALPQSQRTAFELHTDEGLRWSEVAERIGVSSSGAARQRFSRAVKALRRSLAG